MKWFDFKQRDKLRTMISFRFLFGSLLLSMLALPLPRALAAQQQNPGVVGSADVELDEASARKLVKGCSVPHEVNGPGAPASQIVLLFTVSEKGKLLGVRRVQGAFTHELSAAFANCHFVPYSVNGTPTAFHANITINVK